MNGHFMGAARVLVYAFFLGMIHGFLMANRVIRIEIYRFIGILFEMIINN